MKGLIWGVSVFFVLLIFLGATMSGSDSEPGSAQVAAAAVEDVEAAIAAPSEADKIDSLTREGQLLSNTIAGLAQEGVEAAKANDIERICSLMDEINPKMDRLEVVVDELTWMESVDSSLVADMRLSFAEMKAGLMPANEMC